MNGYIISNLSIDPSIGDNVQFTSGDPLNSYIFNNNIYPSMSNISNKDDLKYFLNSSVLKRACCLR